jgi:energy-coupling factor transport system permease protein
VMGDITLGQYYPGDSPLHKADPRVKILMSLALMIIVFVAIWRDTAAVGPIWSAVSCRRRSIPT